MMYLGTLGRMVAIKCPTEQHVETTSRYTFSTTLGGSVKAQTGPIGRRSWSIGLGSLATPSEVGTLVEFADGVWGAGPFWFIPTDAPVVNMLTPAASSCHRDSIRLTGGAILMGTPPMNLGDDGVAARSLWKSSAGTALLGSPVPVVSGSVVTGSVWMVGSGRLLVAFFDYAGQQIGSELSRTFASLVPSRHVVTAKAPEAAVSVQLQVTAGVTQAARPALTWTDEVYEWGDGQGCEQAVVHNTSRDLTKAWRNPKTGRWSNLSFIVQEVGFSS